MDTLTFLEAILPAGGIHYLAVGRKGSNGVGHKAYTTLAEMAEAIIANDAKPDYTVYHACSTYKEAYVQVEGTDKKKYRIPENTRSAKAFWVDLDVGEEKAASGKGYASKNDAIRALDTFCARHGFPKSLVVDSGNGIHAYWPITEEIPPAEWKSIAENLKGALRHFDVRADPTRTADFASILRPVGSHNKKDPNDWKLVAVKRVVGPYPVATLVAALSNIIANHNIEVAPVYDRTERNALPEGLNDDLLGHAYPELENDADMVAAKCQQVKAMVDAKGQVNYEVWRGVIGITTFCKDGHVKAHEWSAGSPTYSKYDTEQKFVTWNSGPTTCTFLETNNPGGCDGCIHKGNIKTPLVLGRIEPAPQEAQQKEAVIEGRAIIIDVPKAVKGYDFDKNMGDDGQMIRFHTDKNGVMTVIPFGEYHLYPTTRICQADGTFAVRMMMHMPKKAVREFNLPSYMIAIGGQELQKELGKYEFSVTHNKDAAVHLTAYMRDSLANLVRTTEQMNTMTSFGWKDNMSGFLIGDRLYKRDGTTHKVVLGGMALTRAPAFPVPIGTAEGWAQGVNFIYNREGMEAMQYALCSGFGSLLTPFGESQYKGIPVALTSAGSGKGKTTVCRAALYAFGDANVLTVNGKDGMTDNARPALMGTNNNLPMLVDEVTRIKDEDLSKLLYAASNGVDKVRLVSKQGQGVVLADTHTWAMSMYLTANKHLSLILAMGQSNTKAEAVRIIEIKADTYIPPELDAIEIGVANNHIERNMGSAGEKFIQWCVTHVDEIAERFIKVNQQLVLDNDYAGHAEYRFYRQHAVCTLLAATIMKEIGVCDFDLERLREFTLKHIDKMCNDAIEINEVTGEEALNQMINAMTPRILTTTGYRDVRNDARGIEEVRVSHQEPAGRYIIGDALGKEPMGGRLYLVKKEVRNWCVKNRVDFDTMIAAADANGWLINEADDRFYIARGTQLATPQMRCYCFDMNKMQGGSVSAKFELHTIKSGDKQA